MGAVFLIVFRESLEAAIVLGILLAFLKRAGLGRLGLGGIGRGGSGRRSELRGASAWYFLIVLGDSRAGPSKSSKAASCSWARLS